MSPWRECVRTGGAGLAGLGQQHRGPAQVTGGSHQWGRGDRRQDDGHQEGWCTVFSRRTLLIPALVVMTPGGRKFPELPGLGNQGNWAPRSSPISLLPDLCRPGPHRWENKDTYAAAIRNLRLRELQNDECVTAVRAGLGSIIPLQLLTTLSPREMELRTCGLPYINLEFLKVSGLGPGWQAVPAVACHSTCCVPAFCPPHVRAELGSSPSHS